MAAKRDCASVSAHPQETYVDRLRGTVKWFNNAKGYGCIGRDDGPDVFVHYSASSSEGYKRLQECDPVDFELVQAQEGPHAANVSKGSQQHGSQQQPSPEQAS